MLAQAQETVYLKAKKDKKTPMVLARLAKQTSVLYVEALNILAQPLLKDHFGKQWLVSVCKIAVLNRGLLCDGVAL